MSVEGFHEGETVHGVLCSEVSRRRKRGRR